MEKKANKPTPPDDLEGEALLEWGRISEELAHLELLDRSDRAIMVVHCQTWATWREAQKMVAKYGSVIKYSNGVPGPAPFFKTATEAAKQLRGTLADMGLTPASRHKMQASKRTADEPGELQF